MKPHGMGDLYAAQTVGVGFHSFLCEGAAPWQAARSKNFSLGWFPSSVFLRVPSRVFAAPHSPVVPPAILILTNLGATTESCPYKFGKYLPIIGDFRGVGAGLRARPVKISFS